MTFPDFFYREKHTVYAASRAFGGRSRSSFNSPESFCVWHINVHRYELQMDIDIASPSST